MKPFILKIISFSVLLVISMFIVFNMADGSSDAMYLKFTTPKQHSLIIGSSRAAQGIQPKYLNKVLERNDIYNYAFQIPSSPYGAIYLESIKKKLDKDTQKGLFILEVNPWTLSTTVDPNTNKSYLSEEGGFLERTANVNLNPNVEYLVESLGKKYSDIIKNRNRKGEDLTYIVEDDGWLHVSLKSANSSKAESIDKKIARYKNKLTYYKGFSSYRIAYLTQTIQFLKQYGTVYLVRVPVVQGMLDIENQLESTFDKQLDSIALINDVNYINMMPELYKYNYTDGNHLNVEAGSQFSKDLAKKIKMLSK